ncbi:MAG: FecR domain-containing protein [Pedobacter sp.]|uniref:FecR family protein n=1 Tax=Pedobacter sp. TaxID=1411316 RepID=UPI0033989AB3
MNLSRPSAGFVRNHLKIRELTTGDNQRDLYERFLLGKCNATELKQLIDWFGTEEYAVLQELIQQKLNNETAISPPKEEYNERYDRILSHIKSEISIQPKTGSVSWWKVAAVVFVTLAAGLSGYYYMAAPAKKPVLANVKKKADVKPGSSKAFLVLAGGQKVVLANLSSGPIQALSGEQIRKTADGEIIYGPASRHSGKPAEYNTLQTPKGGQYRVILSDGTKVWLNAASSLRYAASFGNLKERKVELTGEAYFEVAKDRIHPFIVQTDDQQIRVLGTHFNVNAYHDEGGSRTTLLEGSIRAKTGNTSAIVAPGQQVLSHHHQLKIAKADTELATAWKNNQFMFEGTPLKVLMKNLARWYNVEIIYAANTPEISFNGSVSKFENISVILNILESTRKVHFKVEGRTIYVGN